MPIVDDKKRQSPSAKNACPVPVIPPFDFELRVAEAEPEALCNTNRTSFLDQTMYTVSEYNATAAEFGTQSVLSATRDDLGKSIVTNGLGEVRAENVDTFVKSVLQYGVSDSLNILEGSLSTCSTINPRRSSGTNGVKERLSFTKEQRQYLLSTPDVSGRLARLAELEQMARQEIYGAWRINITLSQLALQRIMPTIRCYKAPRVKKPGHRDVFVIHSKDMDYQLDDEVPVVQLSTISHRAPSSCTDFSPKEGNLEDTGRHSVAGHFQMIALTGRAINPKKNANPVVVNETWDFLSLPTASEVLNGGGVFFKFVSCPATKLDDDTLKLIDSLINLSSFKNEVVENNVPWINIFSAEEQRGLIVIAVKTMHIIPGIRLSDITPELICSLDYQQNCQPGQNKFEKIDVPYTFRQVKTVIKYVYNVTIQLKVSEITDLSVLQGLKDVDGMVPAKTFMLERTKRNIENTDSTVKVRSFLFYYPVNEGVLVSNQTIVLNNSLPRLLTSILQSFSSQGASEAGQMAKQTRQYLIQKFGDCRCSS
ncbi:hypothetical protein TRVL_06069 [Trypanosoma vivax]|nr:hypothetical protein TRVL_06069 [Trypanosoma vivax]